jgi:lysyl-tRNA synthetase, class I
LSGEIAKALGGLPPEGFNYELFLDEQGQKISKSKGNGLTIDEWLAYGTPESLALFMYNKPREAKRLYFDVIPRHVDDYLTFLEKYPGQDGKTRLGNPVWYLHSGHPPEPERIGSAGNQPGTTVSFSMLLNLTAVANSEDPGVLWGFIRRYAPDVSHATHPRLDQLVQRAVRYFRDFVKPQKSYRLPDEVEAASLARLDKALAVFESGERPATAEAIQEEIYNVGRAEPRYQDLKAKGATPERPGVSIEWFNTIYQVLLGEPRGPRFGSFVALYGVKETRALIQKALAGDLVREHAAFLSERAA